MSLDRTTRIAAGQDMLPLGVGEPIEPLPAMDFHSPGAGPPRYTVHSTPIGELLLISDGAAITGLYMLPDQRYSPSIAENWIPDEGPFGELRRQLDAYFAGELRVFDLPLAPRGTPFQRDVWSVLSTIPYGQTTTYGEIAEAIGRPLAARAVGMANGRNPISIILPCHRVIGSNGSLTGYGGGLPRKERLLSMERAGHIVQQPLASGFATPSTPS